MAKFVPFDEVEQLATIEQLAEMLNLPAKRSGQQLRCACPVHGGDDRSLAISPHVKSRKGSEGVFYCQKAGEGGDRIALVAHCMEMGQQDAALFIQSQFGTVDPVPDRDTGHTVPRKNQATAFDPLKFASKLVWHEEVAKLGLSQDEAAQLGVGWHPQRKACFFPVRHVNGDISAFIGCDAQHKLKLPPQYLPPQSNVVRLPKRA